MRLRNLCRLRTTLQLARPMQVALSHEVRGAEPCEGSNEVESYRNPKRRQMKVKVQPILPSSS